MRLQLSPFAILGLLPFLYVAGVGLSDLSSSQVPVAALAFVLGFFLVLYNTLDLPHATIVFAIGSLFFALEVIFALANPTAIGSAAGEFAWGTLLVGPVFLFLSLERTEVGAGVRLFGLQLSLAVSFLLLAAPAIRASSSRPDDAAGLLTATFAGLGQQVTGVGAIIAGRAAVYLPLRASNDPWFVGLASLAVLATLLSFLRPVTGRGIQLPSRSRVGREPDTDPSARDQLSPRFREVLRSRSVEAGAPPGQYPGVPGVLGAGIATGLFLVALFVDPAAALLFTSIAIAGLFVVVFLVLGSPP
ncbi:MAG TPA: hypothetical protein VEK13_07260 [Thermoplasmata archaeon]|nr:hypothetical protein [Thermoplasmata archaeon]